MPNDHTRERVHAVQLLRAIAAATVAAVHLAFGFADHIGEGLGFASVPGGAAQLAVAIFFAVSGFIMVVSSTHMFGTPDGTRMFLVRRAVRILPSYWIATLFLIAVWLLLQGRSVDPADLGQSLLLWPYWPENGTAPAPLLWPGWTLFYEMVFYALFAVGVSAGRSRAAITSIGAICLLCAAGVFWTFESAFLFSVTRPVMLVFAGGVLLGVLREAGFVFPPWLRVLAALGAIGVWFAVPPPGGGRDLGFAYTAWVGIPAFLICAALVSGPLRLPAFALIDRAGDASYALYLLHIPIAHAWMWCFSKVHFIGGAWAYLVSALAVSAVSSWLFFAYVERPLTRFLNRRLGAVRRGDALLQQTGV